MSNINLKPGDRLAVVYEAVRPVVDGEPWPTGNGNEVQPLGNKWMNKWVFAAVRHDKPSERNEDLKLFCFDQESMTVQALQAQIIMEMLHEKPKGV